MIMKNRIATRAYVCAPRLALVFSGANGLIMGPVIEAVYRAPREVRGDVLLWVGVRESVERYFVSFGGAGIAIESSTSFGA